MPTNTNLQMICDRGLQALAEVKAHVAKLANLDVEIKQAESKLAGLNGQIAQAQQLASQVQEVDQQVRRKQAELADLNSQIAAKHEAHGRIDADLNGIIKRVASWTANQ